MTTITRASREDIDLMMGRGEVRFDPDAPVGPSPEPSFWDDASPVYPKKKTAISLRVDDDVLAFFRAAGPGHLTRMHAVLRRHVEEEKAKGPKGR